MIKNVSFVVFIVFIAMGCQQAPLPYQNHDVPVSERVSDLMQRMTLKEKIQQLSGPPPQEGVYSLSVKHTPANERLGIPGFQMADGPLGVTEGSSTAFPAATLMASTWNDSLLYQVGVAMAKETRAHNANVLLGGCVNLHRYSLAGRNFESFGEDPYLASRMVVPSIKGIQSEKIVGTVKHYALNNQELYRYVSNSVVDERTMHELYFPAFKAAVQDAGVWTVMSAYNRINGSYASASKYLLTDVLKEQWGFQGFVVSDWISVWETVAPANNGLDMEMPEALYFGDNLLKAVNEGLVTEETINDKVERILTVKFKAGLFDNYHRYGDTAVIASEAHRSLALKAAEQGIVMLENKGMLPLDKENVKRIALVGPLYDQILTGGSGSSKVTPKGGKTLYQAIKEKFGQAIVDTAKGDLISLDPNIIPAKYLSFQGKLGLMGTYYNTIDFSDEPFTQQISQEINYQLGLGSFIDGFNADSISVTWEGEITAPETRTYRFDLVSDDGSRLYINNQLIIDHWFQHGDVLKSGTVKLQKGQSYNIKIEYNDETLGSTIKLGWDYYPEANPEEQMMQEAVDAASKADVVVAALGFNELTEGEGNDRKTLSLYFQQEELLQRVLEANKNVIVLLYGGGTMDVTGWADKVQGIFYMCYPGQEGADAIANILAGDAVPSGKLPFTWIAEEKQCPAFAEYYITPHEVEYKEGLFIGYRYTDKYNMKPSYPFGYGLSYTQFSYDNIQFNQTDSLVTISVEITNTGDVAGDEIVQLYVSDVNPVVERPEKELKNFKRISLNPGETKQISMRVHKNDLRYYNPDNDAWIFNPGPYKFLVGASAGDIKLTTEQKL